MMGDWEKQRLETAVSDGNGSRVRWHWQSEIIPGRGTAPGGGGRPRVPPVTKALLIANLVIFVLDVMILPRAHPAYGPLTQFGAFTVRTAVFEGRLWEFLTFQFLHASVGHILFNSIGLYFFGPFMERWWGTAGGSWPSICCAGWPGACCLCC